MRTGQEKKGWTAKTIPARFLRLTEKQTLPI